MNNSLTNPMEKHVLDMNSFVGTSDASTMAESSDPGWLPKMGKDQSQTPSKTIQDELVSSISEKLSLVSAFPSECCIFRVHENLRAVNESAYVPKLVAIGPFHSGKENVRAMEEHKWRYLKSFLSRSTFALQEYIGAIRDLEQRALKCYAETLNLSSNAFAQMMLLDGCFIIELCLKYRLTVLREKDDPIFNTSWMLTALNRDLMLLENQIPFCVLEHLFILNQVDPYKDPLEYLTETALIFFTWMLPITPHMIPDHKYNHLLELIHHSLLPSHVSKSFKSLRALKPTNCTMKLRQYGIKFKKGEENNLFDVKFNQGVLEIPPLRVHDLTEPLFRNLIAYEQYRKDYNEYTSYAFLMDGLINDTNDVGHLQHHQIIYNWLGSNEDVCLLFNKLCVGVNLELFYFFDLAEQVNGYCTRKWHEWRAALMRDYFNSPWAILSFVAAMLIIIFTFTQTLFSLLSYFTGGS